MEGYSTKRKLFGGEVEIIIPFIDQVQGKIAADEAYKEGLRLQKIFNFYDPKSELSKLNNNRKIKPSKELREVLQKSLELCEVTKGKYDVSKGKIFLARKKGFEEPEISCSYKDIQLGKEITLTNKDVLIDLGSSAKGYIVDKMLEKLKEEGVEAGLIDGRGDIACFGQEFTIEIQHPRNPEENLGSVKIKDESIATSGDYKQFSENYNKNHILNNQTAAVTVISNDLFTADLLATVLSITQEQNIISLLKQTGSLAMITTKDIRTQYFNGFNEKL